MMVIENFQREGSLKGLKKWLGVVLYVSIVCEMLFFPSLENFAGCVMSFIVWLIFKNFFLKQDIIVNHPFSFLVYFSMFLTRYIPLPATLLEGKPITWGFQVPFLTFFFETVLFIVASLSYYFIIRRNDFHNNNIQKLLFKLRFFDSNPKMLWVLGCIGVVTRIISMAEGTAEYGDVGGKFIVGLRYLQYSPIILLFPKLSGIDYKKNFFIWFYILLLIVISFATNSRREMIYPLSTVGLLFFISIIKTNMSIFKRFSPYKIISILLIVFFGLQFVSNVSIAMLANRSGRLDISRSELFQNTLETLQDRQLMKNLRSMSFEEKSTISSYYHGWDETYLDNFMLNRFGNLRVSDQTLYYADKIGFGNVKMQETFFNKVFAILPTPILNSFNIDVNKSDLDFSPGDMLYLLGSNTYSFALGGYRVTSLSADGLATFGYFSFLIFFILLFISFKLLDNLVYYSNGKVVYSTLGLINIFGIFGMFRNSIGSINLVNYIFRGFWQDCFTFGIMIFLVRILLLLIKKVN